MEEHTLTKRALKRDQKKQALIEAAETMIAKSGLASVKVRDLADHIGVALGSVYNIITDLDALILLINSRTLNRLNTALDSALNEVNENQPLDKLIVAAHTYHHFAVDNYHLWHALFDHRISEEKQVPKWVSAERKQPFLHVIKPLSHLMAQTSEAKIFTFSQTLFSAIHGMVLIGLETQDIGVRSENLDDEITQFLHLIANGLSSKYGQQ
ncbi:TetR/AcrR family transcriptional regulator [Bartonella tamiae]|uniref:HTH tetR-type domain-containing protein n=1 Tax=Bartonella tamiae Th239 TaxID=1094558 RepID=J0QZD7_9HYPH|nr:TetR family transcriptional regulator [Bartonella tamiae]EJF91496.1 hypothetical protein ME5_00191 [Bartonella tamiae Th239]EJF92520.1 hypothetical protein MEG_01690 [Bartonella tamiae Th307]